MTVKKPSEVERSYAESHRQYHGMPTLGSQIDDVDHMKGILKVFCGSDVELRTMALRLAVSIDMDQRFTGDVLAWQNAFFQDALMHSTEYRSLMSSFDEF